MLVGCAAPICRPPGGPAPAHTAATYTEPDFRLIVPEGRPMAQRKPTTSASRKTLSSKPKSGQGRPPAKKPGKSIVNQKQTPWGLVATATVVVIFAAAIIVYAVTRHKSSSTDSWSSPELADAKAISGVTYKTEPNHNHVQGVLKYDTSPPTGGDHSQYWADCTGTVYPKAIANENAVHARARRRL